MHFIWISIFLPGMLFVVWTNPDLRRPRIWLISLAIAGVGLLGVIGFDLFGFFSGGGRPEHGLMRAVFAVIIATDLPFVALAIGSAMNWVISRREMRNEK